MVELLHVDEFEALVRIRGEECRHVRQVLAAVEHGLLFAAELGEQFVERLLQRIGERARVPDKDDAAIRLEHA